MNMKYDTKNPSKLKKLAETHAAFGATIGEIAAYFRVDRTTVCTWRKKYPDFNDAVREVQDRVDDLVESALLKNATGYDYSEEKITNNDDGSSQVQTIRRHKAPDTQAQKLWLVNRRPDRWSDKATIQTNGNVSITFVDDIPDTED